jgi:hypothetical protein
VKDQTPRVVDHARLAVALTMLANDLMALVPEVLADQVSQAQRHQLAETLDTLARQLRHPGPEPPSAKGAA